MPAGKCIYAQGYFVTRTDTGICFNGEKARKTNKPNAEYCVNRI